MSEGAVVHVLGCGRAARVILRRLTVTGRVRPGLIVNRSLASAREAVAFVGAGEPADAFDARIAGGWLMLGLPDGLLADSGAALLGSLPARPQLAFHLSGSVPASELASGDIDVASVHPVRAFAEPASAEAAFAGTWCVAEGEAAALARLRPVFEAAGGRWLEFAAGDKRAWHAATVAASNFLVTVQALARDLAAEAGLSRAQAAEVLCDLQQGTLDTLRHSTPAQALTGPIERSDEAACQRLAAAAGGLEPGQGELFSTLGRATLALARRKRGEREADRRLAELFAATSR